MKYFAAAFSMVALVACQEAPAPSQGNGAASPEAPDGAIRAVPMPSAPLDQSRTLTRIAFGSCADQQEDQSIWDQVASEAPDLFLFIGDNVYGDVDSGDPALPELKAAYMRLAQSEPFSRLRAATPMLTMWDDHDFGMNDSAASFKFRQDAEALYEYVWAIEEDDPRRTRPGVYGSWMFGEEEGRRVQLIMLDTRFFRSELMETDDRGARGKERYLPDDDPSKTMLGEAQWTWLEEELNKPADLRLVVSSIQVIAEGHGWEAWKMLPRERSRLYSLIDTADANGVIILSGDRHSGALYRKSDVGDYPLYEATSSSLNLPSSRWRAERGETYVEPGPNRLAGMFYEANYGMVEIDWEAGAVTLSVRAEDGSPFGTQTVMLEDLR